MSDKKPLNINISQLALWITTAAPLWGLIAFGINYEDQLVKRPDIEMLQTKAASAEKDLDASIERLEIKMLIYSTKESLTQEQQVAYDRAKARLINLERQRDEETQ